MIEEVVEDLLLFVDPNIGDDLDLTREYQFLDKELAELYPEPEKPPGTRVVDKLVKVYQRDGAERWMLLHVEVQGQNKGDFAGRMFEYYYRLTDRYKHPVAAIAVFTGRGSGGLPQEYEARCLWTTMRYEYKTLAISNYSDSELTASTNPFAAVLLVAKEILLRSPGSDADWDKILLENKLKIVRLVNEKLTVYGDKKAAAILRFLNNYVAFKMPETNRIFMEQMDVITGKKNTMGILEQLIEIKSGEALEEGKKLGRLEAVQILLKATDFSDKKIAGLVGVPLSTVKKIHSTLAQPQ
ncbi:MAG TPA: hypothetical protein VL547_21175 [Dinghuibacter sp.]|uniref:hypothetical protein n=1 Tax=Dinghuibacter sp. TaxID=2024697 RepID=UPI002C786ED4|nr:hypothetical protein [Dinghuibacter sp.]HTJ14571.1 hypothetical protein [Dinghuibacter sp.]